MTDINRTKTVSYSGKQMYELVNDVALYSEFVPFCSNSRVDSRTPDEIRATLSFSRGGLHKSFTTLNRLQAHKMIEIRLINGPFRQLRGFWKFEPLPGERDNQCRVSLDLEFEFTSRWLALMFGPLFNEIAIRLVDSFCKRADVIYGRKKMICISVAYATLNKQIEIPLVVEENCTVALAIERSGILQQFSEINLTTAIVGIYSKRTALEANLGDGDRIEIYRPLRVDPKEARLLRAKHEKTRLFHS